MTLLVKTETEMGEENVNPNTTVDKSSVVTTTTFKSSSEPGAQLECDTTNRTTDIDDDIKKTSNTSSAPNTTCGTTASTVTSTTAAATTTKTALSSASGIHHSTRLSPKTSSYLSTNPNQHDNNDCATMTLTISASNAQRMLEASHALNSTLSKLQKTVHHNHKNDKRDKDDENGTNSNNNDDNKYLQSSSTSTVLTSTTFSKLLLNAVTTFTSSLAEVEISNNNIHENQLLSKFITSMKNDITNELLTQEEMLISLLLFVDLDKSNKLFTAFEILVGDSNNRNNNSGAQYCEDSNDNSEYVGNASSSSLTTTTTTSIKTPPSLNRNQLRKLFKSFLMSISTCINYQYDNENSETMTTSSSEVSNKIRKIQKDDSPRSTLTKKEKEKQEDCYSVNDDILISIDTKREIEEIANYAANKLIKDLMTQKKTMKDHSSACNTTATKLSHRDKEGGEDTNSSMNDHHFLNAVTFQEFGEWYNTGGFSLVPWLELLDLAKWDHAGRTAAAAAACITKKPMSRVTEAKQDVSDVGSVDKETSMISLSKSNHDNEHQENHIPTQQPKHEFDNSNAFSPALPDIFFKSPIPFKQTQYVTNSTKQHLYHHKIFPSSYSTTDQTDYLRQAVISFDFPSLCTKSRISITRDNILQLQHIVAVTEFSSRSPKQVADVILRQSHKREIEVSLSSSFHHEPFVWAINRKDFNKCIHDLIPTDILKRLPKSEMDYVMNRFNNFFSCYAMANNTNKSNFEDFVNAKELAVGLSFLCFGNKSAKLASTFELMGDPNYAFLSSATLMQYFRSYLTMLVGISLLSSSERITIETSQALVALFRPQGNNVMVDQVSRLHDVIEAGAKLTIDHFHKKYRSSSIYFEDLASWYTDGGYTIANWLEFLDLKKFASLLNEKEHKNFTRPPQNSNTPTKVSRNHHPFSRVDHPFALTPASKRRDRKSRPSTTNPSPDEILFSFPLANNQSLIVLKEDASYVRTVVDQLGLLDLSPESVWKTLSKVAQKNQPVSATVDANSSRVGVKISQQTFVQAVQKVLPSQSKRKRTTTESNFTFNGEETLKNFYQSFDLDQINDVAANQLMGGLTLLCGGKKSSKLSFAFGLFDVRNVNSVKGKSKKVRKKKREEEISLCGKELFYFFRSFLIVMFSCCKQSLDLSADAVFRYISDSSNKVTDDVMKYQWRVRRRERVNFDDFGEWYNEGGFETAPWLELLDLNKWVLLDEEKADKLLKESKPMQKIQKDEIIETPKEVKLSPNHPSLQFEDHQVCPPAPPDDELDPHTDPFLDEIDMDGIGGDFGDMAFLFPDGIGKDIDDPLQEPIRVTKPSEPSPYRLSVKEQEAKPLKFHLCTNESTMYTISINQKRVLLLKRLIVESNLCNTDFSLACEKILEDHNGKQISRKRFNSAMGSILDYSNISDESRSLLFNLFGVIFNEFDSNKVGKADAIELACGLTVLCGGRKSDKLEYAFELLSKKKRVLSRFQMVRYLQSFLLVLLNISSCALGSNEAQEILFTQDGEKAEGNIALARVICGTSSWVTEQIFKSTTNDNKQIIDGAEHIDFDKFADWYTRGGFNHIAWLELLDLRKWVLV